MQLKKQACNFLSKVAILYYGQQVIKELVQNSRISVNFIIQCQYMNITSIYILELETISPFSVVNVMLCIAVF